MSLCVNGWFSLQGGDFVNRNGMYYVDTCLLIWII